MNDSVTLPLWIFAIIAALAFWATISHLLMPSARWFIRRRVNQVIDDLNQRLQLKIHPFKLTKRQALIDRLVLDTEVMRAAEEYAKETGATSEEALHEAAHYAKEIVPSFNAYVYFRVAYRVAQWSARMLYRVRLGSVEEDRKSEIGADTSVVFIMNHRSNIDYVLVAYLVATRSAVSYAVGEWARIWPLQTLIQSLGAFFIRRGSGNTLYRKVLSRYVRMATENGVAQAIYPEGKLSRDGKLQPPKMGLLGYIVASYDPETGRDILFVPVGINYDRVFEDRSLVMRQDSTAPRRGGLYAGWVAIRFVFKNFYLMARGKWHRFGYAGVNFGAPVSMKDYCAKHDVDFGDLDKLAFHAEVENLAGDLMAEIGKVIPVLPVSLVSTVFVDNSGAALSELELKAKVFALMKLLEEKKASVHIPRSDRDYAVTVGLRTLTLRGFVEERDGLYNVVEKEKPLVEYYANAIRHLV